MRQLYEYLRGARGHYVVVSTPETIADQTRRGSKTVLRENLGLERPANQFTVRKQKAA